jgi:hypothetical protein
MLCNTQAERRLLIPGRLFEQAQSFVNVSVNIRMTVIQLKYVFTFLLPAHSSFAHI